MAATLTLGELRTGATSWIRRDLNRTLRVGAASFAVSWLVNFVVITNWGAALGNVIGGATEGTEASGAAYIAIMSLTITSLVVYGMEAGWADLGRSFRALPRAVARMFRQHGVRMWSVVLWGAAVSLLTSGVLDPTLAAAFGLGFLAFAPTAVTGILGRLVTAVWTWLIGFFAPKARPRPPGIGGQLVGVMGAATGFLVASQATETSFQVIGAGVLAVLSYLVLINSTSRAATTAALVLLGMAFWTGLEAVAAAAQGCCGESHHHALEPGMKAAGLSAIAAVAGGIGGVIGAGVGSVLAAHPQDLSSWDDTEGEGPVVTSDPVPPGPTGTTTITLHGDEARAALDAWRRAGAEGGQVDLALPEGEQWQASVSDAAGNSLRSGHLGTRGRVTAIGAVVEGEDGSIAISVDVTTYSPAPPPSPASAPAPDPAAAAIEAGIETAVADTTPPADEAPPAPPPLPDVGEVMSTTSVPERVAPPEKLPDDSGRFAEWVAARAQGTLPPDDLKALQGLIRGETTTANLSGRFTGKWAALLGSTEARTDGMAVKFPTGDRIALRVRDGRVEVRHEASLLSVLADAVADGTGMPKVETAIAAVQEPLDTFNQALAADGRALEAITRHPDGSITIRARVRE